LLCRESSHYYSVTQSTVYSLFFDCETWSVTFREEHRVSVFENTVLRNIVGPKRDEVTGEYRRLRNEELNNLHSSPNIVRVTKSRKIRWARHVALLGRGDVERGFWCETWRKHTIWKT
jgi:hypothetical protein